MFIVSLWRASSLVWDCCVPVVSCRLLSWRQSLRDWQQDSPWKHSAWNGTYNLHGNHFDWRLFIGSFSFLLQVWAPTAECCTEEWCDRMARVRGELHGTTGTPGRKVRGGEGMRGVVCYSRPCSTILCSTIFFWKPSYLLYSPPSPSSSSVLNPPPPFFSRIINLELLSQYSCNEWRLHNSYVVPHHYQYVQSSRFMAYTGWGPWMLYRVEKVATIQA